MRAVFIVAALVLPVLLGGVVVAAEPTVLADFSDPREVGAWRAVHDTVMGGRSDGGLTASGDGALFSGNLSLENRGGFASVRGPRRAYDLRGCNGARIEARGDARRFQLRFRTDDQFDGMAWRAFCTPSPDEWRSFELPFANFEPVFRGRVLGAAGGLDPARIERVGIMLADKTAGPYRLEIRRIVALCD